MTRTHALRPLLCLAILGSATAAAAADGTAWIDDLRLRPGSPLLMLPAFAGEVVGVSEQRKSGSETLRVVLRGDASTVGENVISTVITRDGLARRIEQNDIVAEMQDSLPGVPMSLASQIGQNSLGIFGYALGSRGALNCLYGWQAVSLADRWIIGRDAGPFDEHHALSIRVRLCRTSVAVSDLVAAMSGLQSMAAGSYAQAGAPQAWAAASNYDALAAAQAGAAGPNDAPPLLSGYAMSGQMSQPLPQRRVHVSRPVRHRVRKARADTPAVAAPMAGMPDVPMPQ